MPRVVLGPFVFVSGDVTGQSPLFGYPPTSIEGPSQSVYVVEHRIPLAAGGVVENLGSEQSTYRLAGFLAPRDDTLGPPLLTSPAAGLLSGPGFGQGTVLNADQAKDFLRGLRGSGAQLFTVESTAAQAAGGTQPPIIMYENDFFNITNLTFGFEAGRTYPFYRYTIDLRRRGRNPSYGNSSGTTAGGAEGDGGYYSGHIRIWILRGSSGTSQGETVNGLGFYAASAASGNAKMAIYDNAVPGALQAQSETRPVISGWNYFPLRPTFTATSGATWRFAFKGNVVNTSGFTLGMQTIASIDQEYVSGTDGTFTSDFPATVSPQVSGNRGYATIMVG